MKRVIRPLLLTAGLATCLVGAGNVFAQGGGGGGGGGFGGGGRCNFDPDQMMQRRLEGARTALEVTNDEEWAAIQPLVQKVMEAEQAVPRGMRGFGRGGRGGNGGGGGGGGGGRGGFG